MKCFPTATLRRKYVRVVRENSEGGLSMTPQNYCIAKFVQLAHTHCVLRKTTFKSMRDTKTG